MTTEEVTGASGDSNGLLNALPSMPEFTCRLRAQQQQQEHKYYHCYVSGKHNTYLMVVMIKAYV